MTVTVEITPELKERLTSRARSGGASLEDYIERLLEREAEAPAGSDLLTGPQKAEAFRAWAASFPSKLPLLSLEDVSRESFYRRD